MEGATGGGVVHQKKASAEETNGIPLFLFCCFRTTGSNLLIDEVSEVAVQCWPYQEHVPSFHYQVLSQQTTYIARNCKKHGRLSHGARELCMWIDSTVTEASVALNTNLYPVLLSHGGDCVDFLFFFRSLAKHGIDLGSITNLKIHFADPVPLLELLKVRRHPLIVESKDLTLGSLLNDWFPGYFDPSDLRHLPSRAALTAQLYTQTTLYPVLSKVPLYSITEWNQYYQDAINFKTDKRELESHMPKHLRDVQAKFAVRAILRAGYNWPKLLDLYKACTSPLQFRQELRDIDVQSSIARAIAWMVTDMKLEQNGNRPYVLRIKNQMSPQEYIGYRDRRGYYFVLRVANKFPKCFLTLADLEFSLQDNPIDTPEGFSFSQRLSPKSFCATCGGGSPTSPYGHDVNDNKIFDVNFVDPETYKEWEDEEKALVVTEQTDQDFEAYCRYQQEKEENEHKITSFVMGSSFNKSLLLNRMDEDVDTDSESDPEPTVSEEVREKRSLVWTSMRKFIENNPTLQSHTGLGSDLSKSKRDAKQDKQSQLKYAKKGSGKGSRRNLTDVKKWNSCQETNRFKPVPNSGMAKNTPVALPTASVGGKENVTPTLVASNLLGAGDSWFIGCGGIARTNNNRETRKLVIEQESILFLEHPLGSGVDIIYPYMKTVDIEADRQETDVHVKSTLS